MASPDVAQTTCVFSGAPQKDIGDCRISQSKGKLSAHNCPTKGNKYYLCRRQVQTCGACSCTARYETSCNAVSYWAKQNDEGGYCYKA